MDRIDPSILNFKTLQKNDFDQPASSILMCDNQKWKVSDRPRLKPLCLWIKTKK